MELPEISTLMASLLDYIEDEVYIHTTEGVPIYANAAARKRFGYSLAEFLALPPYGWVPERSRTALPGRLEQLYNHGHARFDSEYIAVDGRIGVYEIQSNAFVLGGDSIVISIGRDVTGRRRMIEDLQLRSELLGLLDEAVLLHESSGAIVYANDAACSLYGYEPDVLTSMTMHDLLPPSSGGALAEEIRSLPISGSVSRVVEHRRRGDRAVRVSVRSALVTRGGDQLVARIVREAADET